MSTLLYQALERLQRYRLTLPCSAQGRGSFASSSLIGFASRIGETKIKKIAIFLLASALLSACAVAPSVPLAGTPWPFRQAALNALQYWDAAGRIAVSNDQEGWHASLHWLQQGQNYAIELLGPLGQGNLSIQGNPRGVSVRTAAGKVLTAANPEQLLEQTTGIRIPLNGLIYWLRGLPDPARPSELAGDSQGRLTRLEQGGWVIDYPRYTQVAGLELPARLQAQRGQLTVKVVIEQWKLTP